MKKWYSKYLQVYEKPFSYAPAAVVEEVRGKLAGLQSEQPLVTVSLIGYNEERHLLACLWSLIEMQCRYPVEIIGVDNESKDRTAEIYRATGVPYYTETRHSCGFARLCGLNHARGKYHINIDSDTLYPPRYVETMVEALERPGIVAVSSLWSYIPDKEHSWLGHGAERLGQPLPPGRRRSLHGQPAAGTAGTGEIGRASCRERV